MTDLEKEAMDFLRANGSYSIDRWNSLGPELKAALSAAGDTIRREQAAMIALYVFDPIEAVRVLQGDEAATRMALESEKGAPA
jgi:hypothetical protein